MSPWEMPIILCVGIAVGFVAAMAYGAFASIRENSHTIILEMENRHLCERLRDMAERIRDLEGGGT